MPSTRIVASVIGISVVVGIVALGLNEPGQEVTESGSSLSGTIEIDGSSTVFPITQAVAEEFHKVHPNVQVSVGVSGTGGGFKRFVVGETDISDASREIKPSEVERAAKNNVEFIRLTVAFDGLSVVANPANSTLECITTEELRGIWEPGSKVNHWDEVRPGLPDQKFRLYGPDTDSGTFDYFTKVIVGEEDASRPDYTASADDNVLIRGIAGDKNGLGYFGFAYYKESANLLKLLAIDSGSGCVYPTVKTINDGSYAPLSRPIFIYVNTDALKRPEVVAFLEFYMDDAAQLVREVGYVPLPDSQYEDGRAAIQTAIRAIKVTGGAPG